MRIFHVDVADVCSLTVSELTQCGFEIIEIIDGLAIHFQDHRAARDGGFRQQVTRVSNVDAAWLTVVVSGLLIGQRIDRPVAKFQEFVGRYRMQIINSHRVYQLSAATLDLDFDFLPDMTVEHGFKRYEVSGECPINPNENIAGRQLAPSG